jgi:formyl-CoA transferase
MPVPFATEFQAALGGPPDALDRLSVSGEGELHSAYRVTDLAVASIGVAGLAAAELVESVTGESRQVTVDRALASAWFGSAVAPVGWMLPSVWDPLARNYRARNGWIRLHTNAPPHRAAALAVLGALADPSDVRRAVRRWDAVELETAIVDAGGCAAVMHSRQEWLAHPQGTAVRQEPLLDWRTGSASIRPDADQLTPDRPLAGLRVLDLTRVIAGPVATRFLAGLGAEVLRVDPPGWNEAAIVPNMTLGKRAARLDARTSEGSERLRELISTADVLVHGYRVGALESLGLDARTRQALRPGLIDVSLNAYGFTGPWAQRRGFDSLVQMSNGIAHRGMAWAAADSPTPLPVQALDHATGYLLAAATLRAVVMRRADGTGRIVRSSLARVGAALVAAGDLPVDRPLVSKPEPTEPLETPWGDALMLRPPLEIAGVPLSFDQPPRELGTDEPRWA